MAIIFVKWGTNYIPYARHHNPLLIRNHSWILTIHKDRIFWKTLLENKEMVFKNRVKNIKTAGYNGTRTVSILLYFTYVSSQSLDHALITIVGPNIFFWRCQHISCLLLQWKRHVTTSFSYIYSGGNCQIWSLYLHNGMVFYLHL